RGEIAFPMPHNNGKAPSTVKCRSRRARARECSSQLRNTSAYESLFNEVLWACGRFLVSGKFASCLNGRPGTPSYAPPGLAARHQGERVELYRRETGRVAVRTELV